MLPVSPFVPSFVSRRKRNTRPKLSKKKTKQFRAEDKYYEGESSKKRGTKKSDTADTKWKKNLREKTTKDSIHRPKNYVLQSESQRGFYNTIVRRNPRAVRSIRGRQLFKGPINYENPTLEKPNYQDGAILERSPYQEGTILDRQTYRDAPINHDGPILEGLFKHEGFISEGPVIHEGPYPEEPEFLPEPNQMRPAVAGGQDAPRNGAPWLVCYFT